MAGLSHWRAGGNNVSSRSAHRAKERKVARAEATIASACAPAETRPWSQERKTPHLALVASPSPTKKEAPRPRSIPSRSQQRGRDQLAAKAGALQHVEATGHVLGDRQPRQISAARQVGDVAPRRAERKEVALDERRALPQRQAARVARRYDAHQSGFHRSVETEEALENPAIAVEAQIRFQEAQLGFEAPVLVGGRALQPLAERPIALRTTLERSRLCHRGAARTYITVDDGVWRRRRNPDFTESPDGTISRKRCLDYQRGGLAGGASSRNGVTIDSRTFTSFEIAM
jgi:hypothetical protein